MADDLRSVAGSARVPLPGARAVGPADPNQQLTVTVYVRRKPSANKLASVEQLSQSVPEQRGYLSPEEAEVEFGADQADRQGCRVRS